MAENLREIKEWSQDPWMESLVLDVQIQLAEAERGQNDGEDQQMVPEGQEQQEIEDYKRLMDELWAA